MIWNEEKLNQLPQKHGFRLRGMDMTRLETFSDAAFAFAITLLVISIDSIPKSYHEFLIALKGIPAFAASFASIAFIWIGHRKWSRRYGLEDMTSTLISLILIFVMLVYIYPLKMIFSSLFSWISGGWFPTSFVVVSQEEIINLFIIYGLGFSALMSMMIFLYNHAKKVADQLLLNPLERIKTIEDIVSSMVLAISGLVSAGFAWMMPPNIGIYAGFVYVSLPISMPIVAIYYSKKAQRLESV